MAGRFQAKKAVREQVFTKIALMGSSGSGKTYGALRLASGMADELKKTLGRDAKILMANTEASRGRYYANEFTYDIVDLEPPYNPELFVDLVQYSVDEGYDILIIDSSSAEWEGKGGCLELHQAAGGQYQHWKAVTPRHDKFIRAISDSPIHIIATMRGKDAYEIEKDERGKTSVKKLGVGAKQRDGFEYEFTCTFLIDQATHIATPQKDNTHIWDNETVSILSESYGSKVIKWANSGEGYTPRAYISEPAKTDTSNSQPNGTITSDELVNDKINETKTLIDALVSNGVERLAIAEIIKNHHTVGGKPSANYQTIKDLGVFDNIIEDLKKLVSD